MCCRSALQTEEFSVAFWNREGASLAMWRERHQDEFPSALRCREIRPTPWLKKWV
jgi:hypothetical protein